jgi:ABC-type lipoprotein export system ATPase subunit
MQTESPSVVLRASGLGKAFAVPGGELRLFRDLDLEIRRGELLAVTGRSGAGKSTLLHILGGMQAPSEGNGGRGRRGPVRRE